MQVHVVQEMLDAMGFDSMEETIGDGAENTEPMQALAISQEAVKGTESPSTLRMIGQIQKQKVLMLVDSSSLHCFVNEKIAAQLKGKERAI